MVAVGEIISCQKINFQKLNPLKLISINIVNMINITNNKYPHDIQCGDIVQNVTIHKEPNIIICWISIRDTGQISCQRLSNFFLVLSRNAYLVVLFHRNIGCYSRLSVLAASYSSLTRLIVGPQIYYTD